MARPRKAAADRSGHPFTVRLTAVERDRLAGEVARLRLPSIGALMRQRALTGTVTVQENVALAAADRVALNRLGVNLNQIARTLNEQGAPALPDVAEALRTTMHGINLVLQRGAALDPETV